MKRLFAGLALAALCFTSQKAAAEEALVWCFNNPDITTLDGQKVKADAVVGLGGKTINAIRVKAVDGDATDYLQLYADGGAEYIALGDALAMPSEDGWVLESLFAGLGDGYARDGIQFMIELGSYSSGNWTALAFSTLADYSELVSEAERDGRRTPTCAVSRRRSRGAAGSSATESSTRSSGSTCRPQRHGLGTFAARAARGVDRHGPAGGGGGSRKSPRARYAGRSVQGLESVSVSNWDAVTG